MRRRGRRKYPKKGPAPPVVVEEIIVEDDSENEGMVAGTHLSDSDPTLISALVKDHCVVCLTRKTRTIFSVSSPTNTEEVDGYELLRRYFGVRTADSLNDIFDAVVFTNKGLLTAEFPAPLLCESCVKTVRELDDWHKKLVTVQRQILLRIRNLRQLVVGNRSSIKAGWDGSESRQRFESELLGNCNGHQKTAKVVLSVLDNFQEVFIEDTHDQIEIHLEHLEQIATFAADDDRDVGMINFQPSKTTTSASTQTDKGSEYSHYGVKIVKVSVDSEEEDNASVPDAAPSSPADLDDDLMDGFNSNDELPETPKEIKSAMEYVKPDIMTKGIQPVDVATSEPPGPFPVGQLPEPSGEIGASFVLVSSESVPTPTSSIIVQQNGDVVSIIHEGMSNASGIAVPGSSIASTAPSSFVQQIGNGASIIREDNQNTSAITIARDKAGNKKKSPEKNKTVLEKEILTNDEIIQSESNEVAELSSDSASEAEEASEDDDRASSENQSSQDSESESEDDSADKRKTKRRSERVKRKGKASSSNEATNKLKPFKCDLCKQLFKRRYDVYRHIRHIHQTEPVLEQPGLKLTCTECDFTCGRMAQLKQHTLNVHQIHSRQINNRTYECNICGYSRDGLRLFAFLDHLREHEGSKKTVSCDDCLQKFTTIQMYHMHPCPQTGRLPGTVTMLIANFDIIRRDSEYKCRFCTGEKFHSEKSIQQHFQEDHEESNPFLCEICKEDVAFKSKNCLKTHMIEVHDAVKFKCRICEKGKMEFKRYDDLHMHMNFEHFGGFFGCSQCSKKFRSRARLEEHAAVHTTEKLYICDICGRQFKTPSGLRRHNEINHNEEETEIAENDEPELDENGQPLPKRPRLSTKKKSHPCTYRPRKNGEAKPFMCTLCDYDCCTSKLYRRHMQNDHGIMVERKLNTRTYQCELCDYTNSTVRMKGFVQHLREHENSSKRFTCEDCFENFTSRQLYQFHPCPQTGKIPGTATIHIEGHDIEEKDYSCRFCGTVFASEKNLQKHCLKEHGENAFACQTCNSSGAFISKDALKTHLITEHGAVSYKCRQCVPLKEFTKVYDLFTHTNIEHFGCYYECPDCNKRFVEKLKLRNHMTIHSDAKEHICSFCGVALKSISSMRRHVKMYHVEGVQKHVCEYCSKEFLERSNLKKHIQKIHERDSPNDNEQEVKPETRSSPRRRKRK